MDATASTTERVLSLASPALRVSQHRIFAAAAAIIILHVADDEFLQPQPGTSAADHLSAALVPIGIALVASIGYPRLRPGLRAATVFVFGILRAYAGRSVVAGVEPADRWVIVLLDQEAL